MIEKLWESMVAHPFWALLGIVAALAVLRVFGFSWRAAFRVPKEWRWRVFAKNLAWKTRLYFGLTGDLVSPEEWKEQAAVSETVAAELDDEDAKTRVIDAEEELRNGRKIEVIQAGRGRFWIPLREALARFCAGVFEFFASACRAAWSMCADFGAGCSRHLQQALMRNSRDSAGSKATKPTMASQAEMANLCVGSSIAGIAIFCFLVWLDSGSAWNTSDLTLLLACVSGLLFLAFFAGIAAAASTTKVTKKGKFECFSCLPIRVYMILVLGALGATVVGFSWTSHDGIFLARAVEKYIEPHPASGQWEGQIVSTTEVVEIEPHPFFYGSWNVLGKRVFPATPVCCQKTAADTARGDGRTGGCSAATEPVRLGDRNYRAYAFVPLRHTAEGIKKMLKLEVAGASFSDDYLDTHAKANAIVARKLAAAIASYEDPPLTSVSPMVARPAAASLAEAAYKVAFSKWEAGLRTHVATQLQVRLNPHARGMDGKPKVPNMLEEQKMATGISTHIEWAKARLVKLDSAAVSREAEKVFGPEGTTPPPCTHGGDAAHPDGQCPDQRWCEHNMYNTPHGHYVGARGPEAGMVKCRLPGDEHYLFVAQECLDLESQTPSEQKPAGAMKAQEAADRYGHGAEPRVGSGEPPADHGPSAGAGPSRLAESWCDIQGRHTHILRNDGVCRLEIADAQRLDDAEVAKAVVIRRCNHNSSIGHGSSPLGNCPDPQPWCDHGGGHGHFVGAGGLLCSTCTGSSRPGHSLFNQCPMKAELNVPREKLSKVRYKKYHMLGISIGSQMTPADSPGNMSTTQELAYLNGVTPIFLVNEADPTDIQVRFRVPVYGVGEGVATHLDLVPTDLRNLWQRQEDPNARPPYMVGDWRPSDGFLMPVGPRGPSVAIKVETFEEPDAWWLDHRVREFAKSLKTLVDKGEIKVEEAKTLMQLRMKHDYPSGVRLHLEGMVQWGRINPAIATALKEQIVASGR